jgi:pyruvate formate lyase activating enzyme
LKPGQVGACGVRVAGEGELFTLVYDRIIGRHIDPIEKKPLFHFWPGSHAYSVATAGCNLRCTFCQNWDISQWPKDHLPRKFEWETDDNHEPLCPKLATIPELPGEVISPQETVDAAVASGCKTIAYTYTEPTIFFELVYDTATLAKERGLNNVVVSNGYTSEEPLRLWSEVIDAVNIDLKFFNPQSYRRISRASIEPILDSIRLYHQLGVWIEVTTLVIPGINDSDEELGKIAEFLVSVSPTIPWHISQFYPAWKMQDVPVTPTQTLDRARKIGKNAGLRYVYEGNVPGSPGENTHCYKCDRILVERYGNIMRANHIVDGRCPGCETEIDGVGMSG